MHYLRIQSQSCCSSGETSHQSSKRTSHRGLEPPRTADESSCACSKNEKRARDARAAGGRESHRTGEIWHLGRKLRHTLLVSSYTFVAFVCYSFCSECVSRVCLQFYCCHRKGWRIIRFGVFICISSLILIFTCIARTCSSTAQAQQEVELPLKSNGRVESWEIKIHFVLHCALSLKVGCQESVRAILVLSCYLHLT